MRSASQRAMVSKKRSIRFGHAFSPSCAFEFRTLNDIIRKSFGTGADEFAVDALNRVVVPPRTTSRERDRRRRFIGVGWYSGDRLSVGWQSFGERSRR